MATIIKAFRWILGIFISLILLILVSAALVLTPVSVNLSNPANLLKWINDSGAYTSATEIVFEEVSKEIRKTQDMEEMPISTDVIKELMGAILSPDFLESSTREIINGVYLWLNGETTAPQFEIDLSQKEDQIEVALQSLLYVRLEGLKECSPNAADTTNSEFNPFAAECLPKGFDIDREIQSISEQLLNQVGSIKNIEISGSDLSIDEEILTNAPIAFKWLKLAPVIIAAVTILLTGFIALLIPGTKSDLTVISMPLAIVGLSGLAAFFNKSLLLRQLRSAEPFESFSSGSQLNTVAERLLLSVTNDIFQIMLFLSLFLIIIAVLMITTQILLNSRKV